jgi:hypothetical protein
MDCIQTQHYWSNAARQSFEEKSRSPKSRRKFSTDDGNMILASKDVLPGDHVVVLQRATVPAILRQTKEGKYRVLGPCGALQRYNEEQGISNEYSALEE